MRPPWIEAVPLLAAAGRPVAPLKPRSPFNMPLHADYALLRQPERPDIRPVVYPSLDSLLRAITRERRGLPIELVDQQVQFDHAAEPLDGVNVWRLGDDGGRISLIGWAWLNGGRREQLQSALERADRVIRRAA